MLAVITNVPVFPREDESEGKEPGLITNGKEGCESWSGRVRERGGKVRKERKPVN